MADRLNVLVVDDEYQCRELLREFLDSRGFRVFTADSGEEAWLLYERARHKIDLLITDVVLPGMSGAELVEKIVKRNATLRVIYTTGYGQNEVVREDVMHSGMQVLQKPFRLRLLEKAVEAALGPLCPLCPPQ